MGSLTLVRDDSRGVLTDRQREILDFITPVDPRARLPADACARSACTSASARRTG